MSDPSVDLRVVTVPAIIDLELFEALVEQAASESLLTPEATARLYEAERELERRVLGAFNDE
jgi:PHD/YefM family antitoxin component YafN of YafNO toxin-antitoxin module